MRMASAPFSLLNNLSPRQLLNQVLSFSLVTQRRKTHRGPHAYTKAHMRIKQVDNEILKEKERCVIKLCTYDLKVQRCGFQPVAAPFLSAWFSLVITHMLPSAVILGTVILVVNCRWEHQNLSSFALMLTGMKLDKHTLYFYKRVGQ